MARSLDDGRPNGYEKSMESLFDFLVKTMLLLLACGMILICGPIIYVAFSMSFLYGLAAIVVVPVLVFLYFLLHGLGLFP